MSSAVVVFAPGLLSVVTAVLWGRQAGCVVAGCFGLWWLWRKSTERRDAAILKRARTHVTYVMSPKGHRLAVRWTTGSNKATAPICIPNGLAATLVFVDAIHEARD